MQFKILFSNIGYARGIDGTFEQHIGRMHRLFYNSVSQQREVLDQFKNIVAAEKPDVCCIVEIDSGSFPTASFNQIETLAGEEYPVYDIAGKYGEDSLLTRMPFFKGKCNAFLSRTAFPHEKIYFRHGSKRLVYQITLPGNIRLFFSHFSLQAKVRARQLDEVRNLVKNGGGEVIILADFNIIWGFKELEPLIKDMDLEVLNDEHEHTFLLGERRLTLDLCVCSRSLASKLKLRVIPQPFSDHAALLVEAVL